jgi:hypothetical protein
MLGQSRTPTSISRQGNVRTLNEIVVRIFDCNRGHFCLHNITAYPGSNLTEKFGAFLPVGRGVAMWVREVCVGYKNRKVQPCIFRFQCEPRLEIR